MGVTCQDVDECQVHDPCGFGGQCTNLAGNFSCKCSYPEFIGGVGTRCYDNNECKSMGDDICGDPGSYIDCVNSIGGFHCNCSEGYDSQNISGPCQDVDECSEIPLDDLCGNFSTGCENSNGSYQCVCPQGFNASEMEPCSDIDECEFKSCGGLGTCVNVDGSFYCSCIAGYVTNHSSGFCVDDDECQAVDCSDDDRASCVNTDGSYFCDCGRKGIWSGPGYKCLCKSVEYARTFSKMLTLNEIRKYNGKYRWDISGVMGGGGGGGSLLGIVLTKMWQEGVRLMIS